MPSITASASNFPSAMSAELANRSTAQPLNRLTAQPPTYTSNTTSAVHIPSPRSTTSPWRVTAFTSG